MEAPRVTFRQASFIEASITTLQGKLIGASVFVAVILFFFLGTLRPTVIALTAIPVSIFITALVFKYFGLSINTMTLGGLAIAIGGLVDDAVVDVENVLRRLKEDRAKHPHAPAPAGGRRTPRWRCARHPLRHGDHRAGVHAAVRAAGHGGRLFVPLGIAFIVSTLASLLVSVTVTPVLSFYLLPRMKNLDHGDTGAGLAEGALPQRPAARAAPPAAALAAGAVAVLLAAAAVPFFPTTFLPPFNEGTLLIGLRLNPGVTLAESRRWRARPRCWCAGARGHARGPAQRPGRAGRACRRRARQRAGRGPAARRRADAQHGRDQGRHPRAPGHLPAAIEIGQPISHRIDHMLSGVRSQIAIKIFGEDLDALRGQADALRARLAGIPGMADLEIEKQVLAPQIKVRVDYAAAAQYGVPAPQVLATLQAWSRARKSRRSSRAAAASRWWCACPSARSVEGLGRS
jgi:HME family heavy-metal exporter